MQRIIYTAFVLLLIQISLVVVFNRNSHDLEALTPSSLFVNLSPDKVTSIKITDAEGKQLILNKAEKGWIISASYAAPANSAQIDKLLDQLATAKQGFAVATTSGAAKRFKTAEDKFERHLVIKEGDATVADFYLGTSAGFRHSHARKPGQDEIVSIPVSSYEVEVDPDKWLDNNLANLNKDGLKQIEFDDILLTRNEQEWLLADVPPGEVAKEEIDTFIDKITGLTVESVLDAKEVASLFNEHPAVKFTVTTTENDKVTYSFAQKDDLHVLKMSKSDLYFKVQSWQIDGLTDTTLAKHTNKPKDGEELSTNTGG